jgi:hypothetical protein
MYTTFANYVPIRSMYVRQQHVVVLYSTVVVVQYCASLSQRIVCVTTTQYTTTFVAFLSFLGGVKQRSSLIPISQYLQVFNHGMANQVR